MKINGTIGFTYGGVMGILLHLLIKDMLLINKMWDFIERNSPFFIITVKFSFPGAYT